VAPFGTAAPASGIPDLTASVVTAGDPSITGFQAAEQVMVFEWTGSGTTAPFLTGPTSSGLVVNIDNTGLAGTPYVQTGPAILNLKTDDVSPTIVPDSTRPGQFAIGMATSTTSINVFHGFADYVTHINSALNGTNTILKLVAVGSYNQSTHVFTAY